MKIGIDAHNLEGKRTGVGRYLFNILKVWAQNPGNNEFVLYFKEEIPSDLPKSEKFQCRLLKTRSTAFFMNWSLPWAALFDKADVLFCPDYRAPLSFCGKTAVTLHDIVYESHPEWFNWQSWADKILLRWASKYTARKADLIFAPLEFSKSEIVKYFKIAPEKIAVTPEGVDPNLVCAPGEKEQTAELKEKLGIKGNFIFYVGSIFSRRHLPEILEAFKKFAQKNPDWQFVAAGRDCTGGAVDKLAEDINNELKREAVLRVDFVSDRELKLLYGACAFFIWLSDYEGFGLPPLEAMANGVPVISNDQTSLAETAGPGSLVVHHNGDVEEIYKAMDMLASNDILRSDLIEKGKRQAAKFSWEICARQTLQKISELK